MSGCQYQGYEFGAGYPDSICIDGELWDADSGDGEFLTNGGDIPCPRCNTTTFLRRALSDAKDGGCGLANFYPHVAMLDWEAAIAKARKENMPAAEEFLQDVQPFKTDDWPDRDAVFANPTLWDRTIEREWRFDGANGELVGQGCGE